MTKKRLAKAGTPLPGKRVRGSETGRPLMALLDLASRKQLLRVVWELRDGPLRFRSLQEACGDISPSLLNRRVQELREAELVELSLEGYRLTVLGNGLYHAFQPVSDWANGWAESLKRGTAKA
jgi:DNA-binding HxlR family transcriptional regulator